MLFWTADLIERIGDLSDFQVGLIAVIPFSFGTFGLLYLRRWSDRSGDRRGVLTLGLGLGVVGLIGGAVLPPTVAMAAFAVGTFGLLGSIPVFWGIPAAMVTGRAAAGAIALVNSIGVTGGLIGPVIMGAMKDATGSLDYGLLVLSAVLTVGRGARVDAARGSQGREGPRRRGALRHTGSALQLSATAGPPARRTPVPALWPAPRARSPR